MKTNQSFKLIGFSTENRFEQLRVILNDYRTTTSVDRLAQLINDNVYTSKITEYKIVREVLNTNTHLDNETLLNLIIKEVLLNTPILR